MMLTSKRFDHPSPRFELITQIISVLMGAALGVFILVQIPLVLFSGFPLLFSLLIVVTCIGLLPFLLLPAVSAPAVTVTMEGITLHPRLWREQFVAWSDVHAVKPYPLTPSEGSEATRQLLVGRRKYRPMQGMMLVIPSLSLLYRFHGLVAGEGFKGLIALTNRTHVDYDELIALIPMPMSESK